MVTDSSSSFSISTDSTKLSSDDFNSLVKDSSNSYVEVEGDGDGLLTGGNGNDQLYSDKGNDYLAADKGNDYLEAGNGNDTLYGGEGNDTMYGGGGNDQLYGGGGNDRLYGNKGNDYLTGGNGADTFAFNNKQEGIDVIKDFDGQQGDVIEIDKQGFGASSTDDFQYDSQSGALSFKNAQFVILENPANFSVADNVTLV
ncbi:calcium-binding protein [Myxosarcina sp. GI1]|uniref:calcium-binding protein n=1 Tax=Myxosarcina sp. GI1 TaxID=1541065 RepID=UPI00055A5DEC|nr:calcium-binding protein [Myxosarcina sp. GI1]